MTAIAMIIGTLFWLVVFLGFMVAFFVLLRGGFEGQALVEGALAIIIMIALGVPLSLLARKLSSKVVSKSTGPRDEAPNRQRDNQRGKRRQT